MKFYISIGYIYNSMLSVLCTPQASLYTVFYAIIKKHTLRLPCKPGNLCPLVIQPLKDSYTS